MPSSINDGITAHQRALLAAFVAVLAAEEEERQAELAIRAVRDAHAATLRQAKQAQADAWEDIEKLMAETGEVEITLPDETHDYKIAYTTTPEVADVPDADAVPDPFCKLERVPKKKEILDHLKGLRDRGEALPNWAAIRRNPGKLSYRLVKKGRLGAAPDEES
jgi:hypothetical protein